jgi:hypothetical protein
MLTVLAMILLGITVLTVNNSSLQNGSILTQTQIGIYGISLATSIIEEAAGMAFDQNTDNAAVTSTSALSTTLGPESGETTSPPSALKFNDFDDYNNLPLGTNVAGVDSFMTKVKVYYINDANPEVKVLSPTWFKRMDVTVNGTGVADTGRAKRGLATGDTIKISYIFSYFQFR